MSEIQHFMKMLQSKNPNERYDACEQLRVSPWLPPEAIDALRSATSDANPEVADAAQRAINLHASDEANPKIADKEALRASKDYDTPAMVIMFSMLAGAIGGILVQLAITVFLGDLRINDAQGIIKGILYTPAIMPPLICATFRAIIGGFIGYIIHFNLRHRQMKEIYIILAAFIAGFVITGIVTFCADMGLAQ
jgi:hypothetical protein